MKQKDTEFMKAFAEMVNNSVQQDIVTPRSYFNLVLKDLLQEYYADEPEIAESIKNGAKGFVETKTKRVSMHGMTLYDLNRYTEFHPNARIEHGSCITLFIENYDFFMKISDNDWENRVRELIQRMAYWLNFAGR